MASTCLSTSETALALVEVEDFLEDLGSDMGHPGRGWDTRLYRVRGGVCERWGREGAASAVFSPSAEVAMGEEVQVQCPWCLERQWILVPIDEEGVLSRDCEVCCRPWRVTVWHDAEGRARVVVERE
jgi:hypothetical protein